MSTVCVLSRTELPVKGGCFSEMRDANLEQSLIGMHPGFFFLNSLRIFDPGTVL